MLRSSCLFSLLALTLITVSCRPPTDATISTAPAPLPPEIQAAALERGKVIVAETFSLLSSNLQSAIQTGGVSNALPFCSLAALPLTVSQAEKSGVRIRRVTHKARNPANRADTVELALLERFRADGGSSNPPAPVVTNFNAHTVTFFAPIVLNHELCLKCHGEPGRDITTENLAIIQRLYPQDQATGFQLGELRGAWRVDLPVSAGAVSQ